ncbi:gp53-like domain-containing protein, partial [Pectobacterium sp. B1J-3]|uniref:gp53-like domain-containing protein n=1 Tax=Pectobacterium sp. B1J-3 TaxID=3385371 RepID=UPI003905881E
GFAEALLEENGYQKLPSGLVIQWGAAVGSGDYAIEFPMPFKTACLNMTATHHAHYSGRDAQYSIKIHNVSKTGAELWTNTDVYWFAIGY